MAHVADVTIDSAEVDADLTDFIVFIDLSDMNTDFWSTVANGGGDIRVYKEGGSTELAREVVSCDTTGETGELWLKYTGTLSSTVDTVIEIHADGVSSDYAVTATYGRNNVWSNFDMVTHDYGTTDSTGNSRTRNGINGNTAATGPNGWDAVDLDGVDSWIKYNNAAWFEWENQDFAVWVASKLDSTADGRFWSRQVGSAPTTTLRYNGSNSYYILYKNQANTATIFVIGTVFTPGTTDWHWYVSTYDHSATTGYYFIDGDQKGSNTNAGAGDFSDGTEDLYFGNFLDANTGEEIDGDLAELRVATSFVPSEEWTAAEYSNQNTSTTFYTVTDAPDPPAGVVQAVWFM